MAYTVKYSEHEDKRFTEILKEVNCWISFICKIS